MTTQERQEWVSIFKEAFKDTREYIGKTTSNNNNFGVDESLFRKDKNGAAYKRDEFGKFSKDAGYEVQKMLESIKKMASDMEAASIINKHNLQIIDDIEEAYEKEKKNLSEEDRIRLEGQIKLEKALNKEEEARQEYTKTQQKYADLEAVNTKKYLEIKNKNHKHELELEKKRLDFQEKNLEKTQAIEKRRFEASLKQQEWELKGYNKSGRRNSNFEITNAISTFVKNWKEDSIGRNIGKGVSSVTNGLSSGLNTINSGKMDVGAVADKVTSGLAKMGPYGAAAGGIVQILKTLFDMYSKVDRAASDYARTVGGGVASMDKMKVSMSSMAANMGRVKGLSYDAADLMKSMAEYSTTLGRNLEYMSSMDITAIEDLKKFGVDGGILSEFDTFGLSVQTVSEKLAGMYKESGKRGVNAKAVTDAMTKNLKLAQTYNFQNGLRGLESMARKAVEVKLNMQQVANFADKVSTLEGAMSTGANLSVLGGSFARFGNPLQMLYEGLNDMEGLQDRVINMFGDLGKWDYSKGHVDISVFNKQRMKAASQAMGVDFGEMVKMVDTNARRNIVAGQLRGGLDKETEDYIKNVATLNKSGIAEVTFNQGTDQEYTKAVSELSNADKARLKRESERKGEIEGADMGSILKSTMSIQDRLDQIVNMMRNYIVKAMMKILGVNDAEMFGFDKKQTEQYERISNVLDNRASSLVGKNIATAHKNLTQDDLRLMREMGVIDQYNNYIGNTENEFGFDAYTNSTVAMMMSNAYNQRDVNKKSRGGRVVGPGSGTSDSIPARLSNGEYVVNANATAKNLNTLETINAQGYANGGIVRPIKDQLKSLVVTAGPNVGSNSSSFGSGSLDLNINIGGKIDLEANGAAKSISGSDILTNDIIDSIIRKIQERTDYALNKDKTHIKFM